jgi:hypothetical protein
MSHSLDGTLIGIIAICVVAVVGVVALVLLVRRAANHPGQEHPKRDPLKGLVQGGQHVGGGPTRDAPVPFGGGDPPSVEEEDANNQAERARAHAEHEARVHPEHQATHSDSPMDL